MAIITGGIDRLLIKYPDFDLSKIRLVGWGAGQYFKYRHPLIKHLLPLEYTVCPNQENHGKIINGVEVRSPDCLHTESKEHTVVVIFAEKFFDVMHALRDKFNDLHCINSCQIEEDSGIYSEIADFKNIKLSPIKREWKHPPYTGIFIQGMATEETPYVLAWNRLHHPHAYQCMVTWDHLDPLLLDQCRPWLDKLILAKQPENTGFLYLNAILRSARLGLMHLAEKGIEYAVRGRSDNILKGSIHQVIAKHFSRNRNQGKIAIPTHGWQYIPFMFGEKSMVARTRDLLELWSMPEDSRTPDHTDFHISGSAHFLELRRAVPESILWSRYAKHLGYPVESLEDSQDFMRAKLLPLEPDLRSISLKFVPLFSVSANYEFGLTIEDWKKVYSDPEGAYERVRAVQAMDMSVEDFWQKKIG